MTGCSEDLDACVSYEEYGTLFNDLRSILLAWVDGAQMVDRMLLAG
jgi:hypothetical protein